MWPDYNQQHGKIVCGSWKVLEFFRITEWEPRCLQFTILVTTYDLLTL